MAQFLTAINNYLANEVTMTHRGMMIAIPEDEWVVFQNLTPVEMAGILIDLANVRLALYPKQPRGPKFKFRRFQGGSRAARRVKFPPANRS